MEQADYYLSFLASALVLMELGVEAVLGGMDLVLLLCSFSFSSAG